jgi:hypothetical protein
VLEIIAPGGLEDYFAGLGEILAGDGPPDPAAQQALEEQFGIEADAGSIPRLAAEHGLRMGG